MNAILNNLRGIGRFEHAGHSNPPARRRPVARTSGTTCQEAMGAAAMLGAARTLWTLATRAATGVAAMLGAARPTSTSDLREALPAARR
jgi:hypothetical protein